MPLKELDSTPELRDDPAIKDFNDLPSFVKSFKETKAFVGSSLRPPGPNASDADKADFYAKLATHAPHLVPVKDGDAEAEKALWSKLGRPAKRDDYAFKAPDGVDLNLEGLRDAAEAAGLTKKQFEAMASRTVQGMTAATAKQNEGITALKTEWATAYDTKLRNAAAVAAQMGENEVVVGAIIAGRMSPDALRRWDKIATAIGKEEGQNGGIPRPDAKGGMTRDEAMRQFKEIQRQPGYFKESSPDHEQLVKDAIRLQTILNAG